MWLSSNVARYGLPVLDGRPLPFPSPHQQRGPYIVCGLWTSEPTRLFRPASPSPIQLHRRRRRYDPLFLLLFLPLILRSSTPRDATILANLHRLSLRVCLVQGESRARAHSITACFASSSCPKGGAPHGPAHTTTTTPACLSSTPPTTVPSLEHLIRATDRSISGVRRRRRRVTTPSSSCCPCPSSLVSSSFASLLLCVLRWPSRQRDSEAFGLD